MNKELTRFLIKTQKKNLSEIELIEYLYLYVRDEIKFDFLPEMDDLSADEVFKRKLGQCNNKTVLLFNMLKFFKLKVGAHFSTIDREIHRGFFPAWLLVFTPKEIGHSWIEVEVNGKAVILDGYINDQELYRGARIVNRYKEWETGHSVAEGECGSSSEFSLEGNNFVQMSAVKKDLGVTTQPLEYLRSSKNPNQVNLIKKFFYRLALSGMRRRVLKVRRLGEVIL